MVTASSKKEGSQLKLAKIDFKNYRPQLWKCDEDGTLINMESDYVMDVAGGKLMADSNIIQWREKLLWRSKKNQQWGLSVEGHIHPLTRPGLVLNPKNNEVKEGVELKLQPRGVLSAEYQQWTFATPVFGKHTADRSSSILEGLGDAALQVSSREKYERVIKRTIVRRWGIFPTGGIFIRLNYGTERLALTVEKEAEAGVHAVTVRPLNFKEYKWQLWTFEDGHLINAQTGLALDAEAVQGALVEYGLKSQLHVREKSCSESQYWALSADGEIHLRSNERMVISVASAERTSIAGAQVGLKELRVRKTVQGDKGQVTLQSDAWMRWAFSKPVYGTKTVVTKTGTAEQTVAEETQEVHGCEEEKVAVHEENESEDEDSEEEDDSDDEEEEFDDFDNDTESIALSIASESLASEISLKQSESASTALRKMRPSSSARSSSSSRSSRKDSFTSNDDYTPTGFEKVIRFKTLHGGPFPAGYFFIKSELHGYVLDVKDEVQEGAQLVLTRLRTTDFASQMWSYRNGFLVNLKNPNMAIDAAERRVLAGELVHISERKSSSKDAVNQQWEFSPEGLIHLKTKHSLVLSIKETKRSDTHQYIDVFVQEELTHGQLKSGARREQRWEVLVPSLIPIQTKETGVKVVEAGKKEVPKAIAVAVTFKWLKELLHFKLAANDDWPLSKCFMIRFGADGYYLAAGLEKGTVGLYQLKEDDDHKRFLWIHVNGYLVNYKYMLRLVYTRGKSILKAYEMSYRY